MAGDKETGVCLQVMVRKLDAGAVLGVRRFALTEEMNALDSYRKCEELGARLLEVDLMDYLRGNLTPVPQDESQVTYAHKIDKSESEIDWSKSAEELHNLVRGIAMGPIAQTHRNGKIVKVHRTRVAAMAGGAPGHVAHSSEKSLIVQCGKGSLELLEVQPESRAKMPIEEYLRGYPVKPGINSVSKPKFLIAPSILSADFARLGEEIAAVEKAGADWIHVDVMDGHFVPNLTIGAPVVKSLRPVTKLPLDVHLMIERPERYIEDFCKAGADYLTIHVESSPNTESTLKKIRSLGVKPGITLRPRTPVEDIFPYLSLVDLVLIMTVEPGFGGQSFMRDQVAKISKVRARAPHVLIEVDGGVTDETAKELREADVLVAGSFVFKKDYSAAIRALKDSK